MSVKEIACAAQQELQAKTGLPFKRAHIYELFAAAYGHIAHAAFSASAVFTCVHMLSNALKPDVSSVRDRLLSLGYDASVSGFAASELTMFMKRRSFGAIPLVKLVGMLLPKGGSFERVDSESLLKDAILIEGLEAGAARGNALAHYALALLYVPDNEQGDSGNTYWQNQRLPGQQLFGSARDRADAHAERLATEDKYVRHLQQAFLLGLPEAHLDLADRFGFIDPTSFEMGPVSADADSTWVAQVAARLCRIEDTQGLLRIAAENGDVDAMLTLIDSYDRTDSIRCWTWVYLAQHLGTDLTRDDHKAINEDGSPDDECIGGPCFVGGRDAIELKPLDSKDDAKARRMARKLIDRMAALNVSDIESSNRR
ncbi:hypothetical protein [Stenotrophomonas sp. SY1]|jgi:hypothetical protein|uniref:hypothetical protein n=1 Tax=Stenotrophomonas sp. SY1 TaxID=477235 RepID=UPI001E4287A8|nr:hypothetical protein [Stenotrophomonas sp. SY1]MCD9087076.1 hypothetical protein [Stenotrophomonas sp. SY1]